MGKLTIRDDINESAEKAEMEDVVLGDLRRQGSPNRLVDREIQEDDGWKKQHIHCDKKIGNSWCFEHGKSVPGCSWTQKDQGTTSARELDMDLDNEPFLELERGKFHMDIQHKRARILGYYEAHDSLVTARHGIDSSNVGATVEKDVQAESLVPTENVTVIYYHSDDDIAKSYMDSDLKNDDDDNNNSDNDNVEVRMDLTEDLLHMVLSFLNHRDLCMAGATCKQWHAASSHEEFWRCLDFKDLSITPENFASICHRYPNATLVNILGVPEFDVLSMEAMTSLRKLQCLSLGKGQEPLGDDFFNVLAGCPSLKSLTVNDASLGSSVQEITVYHDKLCELRLIKCRAFRISVRCAQLQTLSLRRTSMTQAMLSCPQLLELDISACHKLLDAAIRSATATCLQLTSLDMSFCSCISDETLREIAFACPNLQVLDASFCPNVSFESVRLPMLRDLKLQSCEGISFASVAAISHSYMLEVLQLDFCSLLTSVSLDLPYLKKISLVHCRKLTDLSLRSPSLSSLKVSNCAALHHIGIVSNSLKKLVLQKQESLTTLLLQCHNLQEVDLTDCESLKNSVCHIFSNGGGCPMIQSLILDNCESLTEVGLITSSLVNLSLVGCRAMTAIELSCPNLQKIYLDGCDHLERAMFCPVGLRSLNLGICPKLSFLQIEAENLLVLELQGCGVLSKASIICPLLASLDASFCSQLKDDSLCAISASCPYIKSLILSSCLSIGFDGLTSLCRLQHLTSLDLSYTFLVDLKPVFESCSQLETLRLMACKYLTNSSLDALYTQGALPALRELDLSYSSVGQSAIEGLLTWCTNLTNVNLNGCANMHDLVWSPSDGSISNVGYSSSPMHADMNGELSSQVCLLEILNCVGCPNIKRVVFPALGRCFYLAKLNLHLSANLKEVDVACPNLISLNLSHCSSLEILKLNCPRLGILILLACDMITEAAVETAISGCNSLETLNLQHCPNIRPVNLGELRMACPSVKRIHSSLWE